MDTTILRTCLPYTPYRMGTECAFFDCSKGTECALCAQSVKGIGPFTKSQSYNFLTVKENVVNMPSVKSSHVPLDTVLLAKVYVVWFWLADPLTVVIAGTCSIGPASNATPLVYFTYQSLFLL